MLSEYPSFKYKEESIIIIPGSKFLKNELKDRLNLMGIEVNNNLDKSTLIDLYESALKDNKNKLKIISQLRKDTDNINSKLAMSQRQSLPHNIISSNISKNKAMNISYEVKPLNSREQIINIVKPIHTNKGQYTQNPFTSSSMNQKQNINLANFSNVNIFPNSLDKNNNYENNKNKLNDTYSKNHINKSNTHNNESSYISNQNSFLKKKNNIINNNLNNNEFNQKYDEETNNNIIYNHHNNEKDVNNINNNLDNNTLNNKIYNNQYKEAINTDYNKGKKNKNDNKRFTYQENNYPINFDNINDNNRKTYTSLEDKIRYKEKNDADIFRKSKNYNQSNLTFSNLNQYKNDTTLNNGNFINTQREPFLSSDDNKNINIRREPDEVSTFSILSTFNNLKNYFLYKKRKYICIHVIILLLILCFTIGILHLINYSWDSITEFFSNFIEILTNPRRLIEAISSFFSSLFFGAINYYYITIIIIIFGVMLYFYAKKKFFEKKCEDIFKRIVQDLINNNSNLDENMGISEEEIYKRYFKINGITYKHFIKRYLPKLKKLLKNEHRIKSYSIIQNDNIINFWKLED